MIIPRIKCFYCSLSIFCKYNFCKKNLWKSATASKMLINSFLKKRIIYFFPANFWWNTKKLRIWHDLLSKLNNYLFLQSNLVRTIAIFIKVGLFYLFWFIFSALTHSLSILLKTKFCMKTIKSPHIYLQKMYIFIQIYTLAWLFKKYQCISLKIPFHFMQNTWLVYFKFEMLLLLRNTAIQNC